MNGGEAFGQYSDTVHFRFLMAGIDDEIPLYNERRCSHIGAAPLNVETERLVFQYQNPGVWVYWLCVLYACCVRVSFHRKKPASSVPEMLW